MPSIRGKKPSAVLLLAAVLSLTFAKGTSAEVQMLTDNFSGLDVTYKVILPDDYDPDGSYPTVLHFAGGSQTLDIVERSTEADWRENAESRGFIVISPASPNGELYFQGADRIFPEFIEHILTNYPVAGDKLHVTGHSNGGISAFHVASLYPEYFISVTGYPGLMNGATSSRLAALAPLCIYMHVGDSDDSWRRAMENQYRAMRAMDMNALFEVETDQIHRLDTSKANLRNRLFDEFERAREGC